MDKKVTVYEDFMLRGVAETASKTVAAPIERVKLLLQRQDEMIKQGTLDRPYAGVIDCIKRTWASEGMLSFWRGNLANVIRSLPSLSPIIVIFAVSKDASFATNIAFGGFTASLTLTCFYPLYFARTKLANDVKGQGVLWPRQYNGLMDVYKKTLVSDGVRGLYRGFVISCVGVFIYRGLQLGLFYTLKPMFLGADFWPSFLLGWTVTIVSGFATYPIGTICRRMMMTSGSGVHYKSSIDCCMQILKNEGFMSLMKGASAGILYSVAGGVVLSGYDLFRDAYIAKRPAYFERLETSITKNRIIVSLISVP